jgi:predicted permease
MRDFGRDLRLAVRGLRRQPLQAAAIVATLAIGIGATTAIYSVFNSVLLRPLPGVERPSELVTVRFQQIDRAPGRRGSFWVSYLDYADVRDGTPGLAGLSASMPMAVDVAVPGAPDPERIDTEIVTANYFDVLGVRPNPGRGFTRGEERPTAETPSAIISRHLWTRLFDSDSAAIGREIMINGHAFVVAGVAPAGFQGRSSITATDLWLPLGAQPQIMPSQGPQLTSRNSRLFGDAFGRLRPGVTMEVAQEQALAAAQASHDFMGRGGKPTPLAPILSAGIGHDVFARDRLMTMFRLVMGGVGLVLLLACANAANLLLARTASRRREIAVAQAIGATRLRIVRQLLADGLVLSTLAGVAGLGLAVWLTSLFEGMRLITFLPAIQQVAIDGRVIVFAAAVSLATGLFFAIVPALASSRVHLTAALKDGHGASRGGRRLLRAGLATLQVGISILLLAGAGLLVQTLANMRELDLGLRLDNLSSFSVNPSRHGYDRERSREYIREAMRRLGTVPGVESVGFGWTTAFLPMRSEHRFQVEGGTDSTWTVAANQVSSGFFQAAGIPLLAGRTFTPRESEEAPARAVGHGVAIVSERLARDVFPDGGALGSRLAMEHPKSHVLEIVGIVGDVRGRPITDEPEPWIYLPADDVSWGRIFVRSSAGFPVVAGSVRDVTRALNPLMPPHDLEPVSASLDRVLAEQRVLARLSALLGGIAALLAAIGIYAMMAGAVGERMREFGIRLALGARAGAIVRIVVRHVVVVTGIGLAAGLGAAAFATRAIESRLFGVAPLDPWTLGAACAMLAAMALTATLLPAWRATRADPVAALRSE